jgi:putative nucleotidyltransferase with HDIG domain
MPAPSRSQTLQSEARDELARAIPRRARVSWSVGLVLAVGFAALVAPAITAERWPLQLRPGTITATQPAPFTVRAPMLVGGGERHVRGGVVVARGETASRDEAAIADAIADGMPRGPLVYLALFALTWALAALFTRGMQRSRQGGLLRVQIVSLAAIAAVAVAAKLVLLSTAASALVVPVAALAIVPAIAQGRIVGLATGVLAAVVVSLLAPFDVGLALLLVVQAATAGLVIAERPRQRWLAALTAGAAAALCTSATYLLLAYLSTGQPPDLRDPLHSPWLAAALGPVLAGVIAVPLLPIYQRLIGEITRGRLVALEDLGHPLLRQIAERAPGTWQHSLMMANMAEIAANAIGANGRLVRVGAYFHDLGKSFQPTYFIENLEPGETSPHDRLPPEVSCDAIFTHVADGIAAARKARLHERIVDFMHMHHGNGVLESLWARCQAEGNPHAFTVERFRCPGHPPQTRETAIVAICDALEIASRTLHKPGADAIDSLVERIVHDKLELGQLDDSGLSMGDLRRITASLRETLRHANHGRIAHPRQPEAPDATAHTEPLPRLDAPDRKPTGGAPVGAALAGTDDALAATADIKDSGPRRGPGAHAARAASEPNETRIRAGTARNAHAAPSDPDGSGSEPVRADMTRDTHEAAPDADRSGRAPVRASHDVVTIIPRRHASDRPRARSEHASMSPVGEAPAPGPEHSARADAGAPRDDSGGAAHPAMTTLPGRAPGPKPLPPPPDLVTPAFATEPGAIQPLATQPLGSQPLPLAVSRTGTPPIGHPRPPTSPPVMPARHPTADPTRTADPIRPADSTRTAGPPAPGALESATTNPPPPRHAPGGPRATPTDPAQIAAALAAIVSRVSAAPFGLPRSPEGQAAGAAPPIDDDARVTMPHMPDLDARVTDQRSAAAAPDLDGRVTDERPAESAFDASTTEPSMAVLDIGDERSVDLPPAPRSSLAARVDAALVDEWGNETPVVAPTSAELRVLFGQPDPTRQLPIDEVELLQRRAAELAEADRRRRPPPPTAEVDPDDIEAAIELAPPARRPVARNTIGVNRPKKSE